MAHAHTLSVLIFLLNWQVHKVRIEDRACATPTLPESAVTTPSCRGARPEGQRNIQDSTFSISGNYFLIKIKIIFFKLQRNWTWIKKQASGYEIHLGASRLVFGKENRWRHFLVCLTLTFDDTKKCTKASSNHFVSF